MDAEVLFIDDVSLDAESLYRAIDDSAQTLVTVVRDQEDEFLDLGNRLMELTVRSESVSKQAGELAGLTSGGGMDERIRELSALTGEMAEVCSAFTSEQGLDEMAKVLEIINGLALYVDDFRRIVRNLQMLSISTRIESARQGGDAKGFDHLAGDVENLALKIDSDSNSILSKLKTLSRLIGSVQTQTKSLADIQSQCAERVKTDVALNIQDLKSLCDNSKSALSSVTAKTRQISDNISEVVSSLQFHDIVRQQVEHVESALAETKDVITTQNGESGNGRDPECSDDTLLKWLSDISRLQAAQLENASSRFGEAVSQIKQSLGGIAETIMLLQDDIKAVFQTRGSQGENALNDIRESIDSIIRAIHDFASKAKEIGALTGMVADTVLEASQFVGDIEEVGEEIELIAINAGIKAAHTGDKGKVFGVLALAIKKLSLKARSQTGRISGSLNEIAEISRLLKKYASRFMNTGRLEDIAERQKDLTGRIGQVNSEFLTMFENLQNNSNALKNLLLDLSEGIRVHDRVCPVLNSAGRNLRLIVQKACRALPRADEIENSQRLEQVLAKYTMEAERLVHESAMTSPAQEPEPETRAGGRRDHVCLSGQGADASQDPQDNADGASLVPDENQVWENVELF